MNGSRRGIGTQLSTLNSQLSSGFTLIELLVVISIIAILSLVVVTNLTSARTKARDAQRTSTILQVDKALQLYMVNYQSSFPPIPGAAGAAGFDALTSGTPPNNPIVGAPNNYIPAGTKIKDPINTGNQTYQFKNTTPGGQPFSSYLLCVQLENPSTGANWYVSNSGSTSLQEAAVSPCN